MTPNDSIRDPVDAVRRYLRPASGPIWQETGPRGTVRLRIPLSPESNWGQYWSWHPDYPQQLLGGWYWYA